MSDENKKENKVDKFEIAFDVIVRCVLPMLIILALAFAILSGAKEFDDLVEERKELKNQVTTVRYDIVSIDFQSQTEGEYSKFVVGTGRIGSTEYYVVYKVLSDGGKILEKLESMSTVIYDTLEEGQTAYVEVDVNGLNKTMATRLYVPKNTIKQEYNLSLE